MVEQLTNEKELILRSQQGDNSAFGILYDHYINSIYNFIFYKTHQKEAAEDLTSQTFFKALKNIQSADSNRSLRSWLYRIAQNTVIDHYRANKRNVGIDDEWDIEDESSDFIPELDTNIQIEKVKKYLNKLSSTERDIVIMRVWQELSYKEIAETLGKTEASCKMMYSRSLEKIRKAVPLAILLLMLLRQ